MASITIRGLDERTKERLRVRAARNKRSMEEEARSILRDAVTNGGTEGMPLGEAVRKRFKALGGVDLVLPQREPMREPPEPDR